MKELLLNKRTKSTIKTLQTKAGTQMLNNNYLQRHQLQTSTYNQSYINYFERILSAAQLLIFFCLFESPFSHNSTSNFPIKSLKNLLLCSLHIKA